MSKVEYFETPNKTRILCGDIGQFNVGISITGIPNNKLNIRNGSNLTFFTYSDNPINYWATSILYVDGKILGSWQSNNFPKPQSVLIITKDNKVDMKQIKNINEINLSNVKYVIGGLGINCNGKLIKYEEEGFNSTVTYSTWKTLIGYSKKNNKLYIITRPSIRNRKTILDMRYDIENNLQKDLLIDYGINMLLAVDGGGSTSMYKDGKIIAGGSGRKIHSYCYFE